MSTESTPLPVLLCGKIPSHLKAVSEIVKPEFEVIKICSTEEHADSAITAIMAGSPVDGTELPKPSIIIVGGGFSNEDVERFRTIESAKTVPWIRPSQERMQAAQQGGKAPPAEIVAKIVRQVLDLHYDEIKSGMGAGEVWLMS